MLNVKKLLTKMLAWMKSPELHNSVANTNTYYTAKRDDTDVSVNFGVGNGGTNHGIWSNKLNKWLIYGDASKVYVNNVPINTNNDNLWTGGAFMNADQTINLSQNVSDQMLGIVLVWSAYVNGAVGNYDWVYTFIPKWHVAGAGGTGVHCPLASGESTIFGGKYVYVYNNKITGNNSNTRTATLGNGYTINNGYWVLRKVIGV